MIFPKIHCPIYHKRYGLNEVVAEVKVLTPHFKLVTDIIPYFREFDFSESLYGDHRIDVSAARHKESLSRLN